MFYYLKLEIISMSFLVIINKNANFLKYYRFLKKLKSKLYVIYLYLIILIFLNLI